MKEIMAEYDGTSLDIEATARHDFKDGEYCLSMSVEDERTLKINVEDELTGERWCGKFEKNYIEELTHKTGNFKQFNIFCNMLESGLNKTSESVTLDLMTYSDLEALRNQKLGAGVHRKASHNSTTQLNSKRYLIMTYTVEFDRIHYPLSLQYFGKSDPRSLKKIIKQQKEEINELKVQMKNKNRHSLLESPERDQEFENLLQEKEEISAELEMCKGVLTKNGFAKELRILKKVIQSLENDLLKERSKYKRMIFKKNEECKQLAEQLEEIKSSERNLKVRCKNLTEELAIMKRASTKSPQLKLPMYVNRWARKEKGQRSVSRERLRTSSSADRRTKTPSPSESRRFNPTAYIEEKQRRQREAQESRGRARQSSLNRSGRRSRSGSFGRLTPEVVGSKPPSNTRLSSAKQRHGPKLRRSSSAGSYGSRHSSFDSGSERRFSKGKKVTQKMENRTKSTGSISRNGSRKSIIKSVYSSGGSDVDEIENRRVSSTRKQSRKSVERIRKHKDEDADDAAYEGSLDIAQIDARLNALQKFMRTNLKEM